MIKGFELNRTGTRVSELLDRQYIVPTLDNAPTSNTTQWQDGEYLTTFRIGELCRVKENGEWIFYRLYDITSDGAVWQKTTHSQINSEEWFTLDKENGILKTVWNLVSEKSISAKGVSASGGGSSEGSANTLYQLLDVLKDSSIDKVSGAEEGNILTFNNGLWKGLPPRGDSEGGVNNEYVDAAIQSVREYIDSLIYLDNGVLFTDYPFASHKSISAKGIGNSSDSTVNYDRLDSWDGYNSSKDGYVLSAKLGYDLKEQIENLDFSDIELNNYYTKEEVNALISPIKEDVDHHKEILKHLSIKDGVLWSDISFASEKSVSAKGIGTNSGNGGGGSVDILDNWENYNDSTKMYALSAKLGAGLRSDIQSNTANINTLSGEVSLLGDRFGDIEVGYEGLNGKVVEIEKNYTDIKGKVDDLTTWFKIDKDGNVYTTFNFYSTKALSAKGVGSSSSGGEGGASTLYQLIDVLSNSNNSAVEGAEDGNVLTFYNGFWKGTKLDIPKVDFTEVNNRIDDLTTRVNVNQSAIESEVTRATNAEKALNDRISPFETILSHLSIKDGALWSDISFVSEKSISAKGIGTGGSSEGGANTLYQLWDVLKDENTDKVAGAIEGNVLTYNGTHWVGTKLEIPNVDLTDINNSIALLQASNEYLLSETNKISGLQATVEELSEDVATNSGNIEKLLPILNWFTLKDGVLTTEHNLVSKKSVSAKGIGTNGETGSASALYQLNDVKSDGNKVQGAVKGSVLTYDGTHWVGAEIVIPEVNFDEVNSRIDTLEDSVEGNTQQITTLSNQFNNFLQGESVKDTIDKWVELEGFLQGFKDTDDLAEILKTKVGKEEYNQAIASIEGTLNSHDTRITNNKTATETNTTAIQGILKTLADWFTLDGDVLRTKYNLASEQSVSAKGIGTSGSGSGVSYDRLDTWEGYTSDKAGYVLSAKLGWDLKTQIENLDLGDFDLSGYYGKGEVDQLLSGKQDVINDLADIRSGAALGATALQEHQTIYGLTIKGSNGTSILSYTPNSKAAELTLSKSHVGLGNVDNLAAKDYFTKLDSHATNGAIIITIGGTEKTIPASALKDSLLLNNVENTKLSAWKGTSNITTVGTITSGTWNGSEIANAYLANSKITIAGNDVSLGGSVTAATLQDSLDIVTLSDSQTISGAKTFGALLTANGGVSVPSTKTIKIGGGTISWDSTNNAFKFSHSVYSLGAMSAKGIGSSSGTGGGVDVDWLNFPSSIVPLNSTYNLGSDDKPWEKLYVKDIKSSKDDLNLNASGYIRMVTDVVFGNTDNYSIGNTGTAYLGNIYSNGNIVATLGEVDAMVTPLSQTLSGVQGDIAMLKTSNTNLSYEIAGIKSGLSQSYYTKTDIDDKGYATQQWVNTQLDSYALESSLGTAASKNWTGTHAGDTSSLVTVEWVNAKNFQPLITSNNKIAYSNISGTPTSLPASDVYAWAKASSKPSYSWSEITNKPTIPSAVTVVDNLNSTSTTSALSANQGKVLKASIDALSGDLGSFPTYSEMEDYVDETITNGLDGYAQKATTLAGYGIADAYTKTQVDSALSGYLPLSGGTIRATAQVPLVLDSSHDGGTTRISFFNKNASWGYLGFNGLNSPCFISQGGVIYPLIHSGNYSSILGSVYAPKAITDSLTNTSVGLTDGYINTFKCDTINGYSPIHSGNIGSQSVASATLAQKLDYHSIFPFSSAKSTYQRFARITLSAQYTGKRAVFKIFNASDTTSVNIGTSFEVYVFAYQQNALGTIPVYKISTNNDDRCYQVYGILNYDSTGCTLDVYLFGGGIIYRRAGVTLISGDADVLSIGDMVDELPSGTLITPQKMGTSYSATKLSTPRTIWGQSFDGTGNVSGNLYLNGSNIYGYNKYSLIEAGSGTVHIGYGYQYKGLSVNLWGSPIRFAASGHYDMTINSYGNVLIGTTTDNGQKLQVNGNILLPNTGVIYMRNAANTANFNILQLESDNAVHLGFHSGGNGGDAHIHGNNIRLRYGTSHSLGLFLNSSGNVTIGNSDLAGTTHKLYVNGNSCFNGILHVGNESSANITLHRNSANYIWAVNSGGYLVLGVQDVGQTSLQNASLMINASEVTPGTRNDAVSLGSSSVRWSNVYTNGIDCTGGISSTTDITALGNVNAINGGLSGKALTIADKASMYMAENDSLVIAQNGVATWTTGKKASTLQIVSEGAIGIDWSTAIVARGGEAYNVVGSGVGISLGGYVMGNYAESVIGRGAGIAAVAESSWYNTTGMAFFVNHDVSNTAENYTEKMRLTSSGRLLPMYNSSQTVGDSSHRWANVYSTSLNVSGAASVGSLTVNGVSLGTIGTAASKNWTGVSTTDSSSLVTENWINSKLNNYATTSSIPTKTSQLTNDSKYISGSIETTVIGGGVGLVTGGAVYSFVEGSLSGYAKKATTLSGYGITDALPKSNPSVTGTLTVAGNVLPSNNDTYSLGSANYRWLKLYANGVDCTGAISSTTNISAQGNVTAINGGLSGKTLSVSGAASVGSLTVNGVAITGNGGFNGGTVSGETIFGSVGSNYMDTYQVYIGGALGALGVEGIIDAWGGVAGNGWEIMDTGDAFFQSVDQASDATLKTIIKDVRLSLGTMANAPLVQFDWNNRNDGKHHVGTIAQYWEGCLPEVVSRTKDGTLALGYGELGVAMGISLAKEMQDMLVRVDNTDSEVDKLKKRIKELEKEIEILKAA